MTHYWRPALETFHRLVFFYSVALEMHGDEVLVGGVFGKTQQSDILLLSHQSKK